MGDAPGWYPDPHTPGRSRYWDGWQWTAHTTQPPRQTKWKDFLTVVSITLGVAIVAAAVAVAAVRHRNNSGGNVVFALSGTAMHATVTYSVGDGGSDQRINRALPWSVRVSANPGDTLVLTAQNEGGGTLTCTITSGGRQVDKHTSRGRFAVVDCSGDA